MANPFDLSGDNYLREKFPLGMAVLDEIPTDDTGHVKACGYDETGDCGCSDMLTRIETAVHDHYNPPPREKRPGDDCYSRTVGDVTYIVHVGDCEMAGKTMTPSGKVVDL